MFLCRRVRETNGFPKYCRVEGKVAYRKKVQQRKEKIMTCD